jgi:hypothetical protein
MLPLALRAVSVALLIIAGLLLALLAWCLLWAVPHAAQVMNEAGVALPGLTVMVIQAAAAPWPLPVLGLVGVLLIVKEFLCEAPLSILLNAIAVLLGAVAVVAVLIAIAMPLISLLPILLHRLAEAAAARGG